jgi:hypothetical protein
MKMLTLILVLTMYRIYYAVTWLYPMYVFPVHTTNTVQNKMFFSL